LPFDVHLMVENSDLLVRELAGIKVVAITVHAEACPRLERTLRLIREHSIQAGVALKPATPLKALEGVLEILDYVLLMTVNPGFAGQAVLPGAFRKIADCRGWLDHCGKPLRIEVDGNVSFEHIPRMVAAGAEILVLGSSLFHKAGSPREKRARVRKGIAAGWWARQESQVAAI
jgi:ribulose-phosphate 3-epimerase